MQYRKGKLIIDRDFVTTYTDLSQEKMNKKGRLVHEAPT